MIKLKNKAENLKILQKVLKKKVIVPKYFFLNVSEYKLNKEKYNKKIFSKLKKNNLIIRSSAYNEDNSNISNAGKYSSLILKKKLSKKIVFNKINIFIKQFKNSKDKIIIQNFINEVDISGVIFTQDINMFSPYYSIEYDKSGKTHLITSGSKNKSIKTEVIYKHYNYNGKFTKLIECCKILEDKLSHDRLDLEFAIKKNKIFIFQIRKLPKPKKTKRINKDFKEALTNIEKKINKINLKNYLLFGKKTIFSNMSDWNPAEMLGDKPKTLAISLYKELICDHIWSKQRKNYGYKDVSPNPLIFSFGGSPYVDLRTDLNSFLPLKLEKNLSEKIINILITKLKKNNDLHDKIEFELIETCYSINSSKRINYLGKKEKVIYLKKIKELTQKIIKNNLYINDEKKINKLDFELKKINKMKIHTINKVFYYVDVLKKFGTLPFAGLARCAFIAQRILLDCKENKLISENEFLNFFGSLKTITSEIGNDLKRLNNKQINKKKFLIKYGHLRPSTYDINSKNYSENFKNYFKKKKIFAKKNKSFSKFKNSKKIDKILIKSLDISLRNFLFFSKKVIILREYAKFKFSKGIDLIFISLIKLAKEIGLKREDLAYIDIKNILNFYNKLELSKLKNELKNEINKNKSEHTFLQYIKLPDVIINSKQIKNFTKGFGKPNFVTNKTVIETCKFVKNKNFSNIKNKIIIIKNADPGYDFIFNHSISGLITQYGGSNSHMAIRCLELGIPAAIGVGEQLFDKLINYKRRIEINCNQKMINFI